MKNSLRALLAVVISIITSSLGWSQLTFLDPVTGSATTAYTLTTVLCQGASIDHCITVSSAGSTHSITSFTGNAGTVVVAPPSNPLPRCFRYTAPFNFTGPNTITFTVTNNLGQSSNLQITIIIVNPNTPINAGADQQLCSPTNFTTLSAVNPDPLATGYWTKISGPGIISGGSDSPAIAGVDQQGGPIVNVTNLQLGSNTFIWHQDYPCDQNVDVVTVFVYNGTPPIADANICLPSPSNHAADTVFVCGSTSSTLCANNPGAAATGTWSIFGGCGTIFNINNPNAPVTNLCAGCNNFEWNIGNGGCPGGETKDTLYLCVYPSVQQAVAPADLTRCIGSFTTVTLAGNALIGANTAQWTFVSGPITPGISSPLTSSTSISGLTQPGIYCFNYTVTSGPCGSTTDQVCISVFSPTSPVNAGPDQTVCLPNNSATMAAVTPTFPAQGSWSVVNGTGSFVNGNSPTSVVNGLSVGINTFRWTVANGNCANNNSFDDVVITVFPVSQPTPDAGADQNLTFNGTPVAASLSATSPIAPGTGLWTVLPSGPVIVSPTNANTSVTNLTPGIYTFTWCLNNGSCDAPICDVVVINVFNCLLNTVSAGPDQNFCTPTNTAVMAANTVTAPATGTWSIVNGNGSIANSNSPITSITNIPIGINTFRWSINNAGCGTNSDDINVNIFDQNSTNASAGPDQEFCISGGPASAVMSANPPVSPATGSWSALNSGTIVSSTNPTTSITGLPVGIHNFVWTINNGPCGTARDTIQIRVFAPGQTAANAGPDQELCSINANTTVVANNLISPATGTWTIVSGGGTITNPNLSATAITNIPVGTNIYRWTIYNGPCATPLQLLDELTIQVYDSAQLTANAEADQDVCSDQTVVNLSGSSYNPPSTASWTISPTGPTIASTTSAITTMSGITPGTTYTVTWSVDNGPCSVTSDSFILNYYNNDQLPADAGNDQSICLPQNSVALESNAADTPATGTWTLLSGPNTPVFTTNNPTTTLGGLIAGTYVLRWTIDNGACSPSETFDDVIIEVFDNDQPIANAGADQELCEPVTETVLTGSLAVSPATGFWTQISGPNAASINNPNLNQVEVSDLIVGCYVFRWTISNGTCNPPTSFDDVQVCVFDDSQTSASAGEDLVLCTPSNSYTATANTVIFPAAGTWTQISGPNTATIANSNSNTSSIGNLIVGTYVFEWCIDNGACFNANTCDQITVEIFDSAAPAADAGDSQEICTPQDAVFMDGNDPVGPATGIWTTVTGSGAIVNSGDPQTQITNLPVGINCFQWSIDNGGCGFGTTFDNVCIEVFPSNQPPADAGEHQDLCTPQSTTLLEGNTPIIPAEGIWVQLTGPNTASFDDVNDPNTGISGLDVGCYTFEWTIDNGACPNPLSRDTVEVCIFDSGFPPSYAGENQDLCSPVSSTLLAADPAVSPGQGTWVQLSGPTAALFSNTNDPNATVSNLTIGVYEFEWSLNYSACGSEADDVVITIFNSAQGPSVAGPDQSLCTPQSSITLAADAVLAPGFGTWSSTSSLIDFVNPNDPTTTAFNLPQGIDTLLWTVFNGPCLAAEFTVDTMFIFLYDVNQPVSDTGDDQEWCTPNNFVTLVGTSQISPATGVWTTTGGSTIQTSNSPTTDVTDLSVGLNTFCWTISNGVCIPPQTSDCVDIYIFDENQEAANAGEDQDVCGTVSNCATLEGNALIFPAEGTWTQLAGPTTVSFTDVNDPLTEVCDMTPGVYTLQWCIDNGPCGPPTCDEMVITIYDNSTEPASVGDDIEMCLPENSATMTANPAALPGFGVWTLITGGGIISDSDNPETTITDLPAGVNEFTWCISNGVCPNSSTCDTIALIVFDPDAPVAQAGPDQEWCTPLGNIFMQATTPAIPGIGTWSAVGNSAIIADPNNPQTEILGLGVGSFTFQWTVYNGPCEVTNTTDLVTINIYDNTQSDADAGNDIDFCTPQNSVTMDANSPIFPAIAFWSISGASEGEINNIFDPNTIISELTPGFHEFIWTINNGPCIPSQTTDSVMVSVFDNLIPAANAGENDSLCAPQDLSPISATLDGSSISGAATGLWEQISGPSSAMIANSSESVTDVSGLLVGTYEFRWTVNNGPCGIFSDEVLVVINDPTATQPSAGQDASYCTPTSTHTMTAAAAISPAIGYWQSISPNVVVVSEDDPATLVTNLTVGQHIFLWHFNNGACGSSFDDISVFIYDEFNPPADAGDDLELCLPQTEVNLSASFPFYPAVGQWSQVEGCGSVLIGDVNNPNTLINQLCIGTQCFLWEVNNGPCPDGITRDTVCVLLYDPGIIADAGPDQSMCTPQNSAIMDSTVPQDPNTGLWSNTQGGGSIVSNDLATTVISDLPVGINCFEWTIYNGPCINPPTDNICIYVYDQGQPPADAGEDQEICFPETSATLTGNVPIVPATGFWTIISGSGNIQNVNSPVTEVTDLGEGDNMFAWTIDNGPCIDPITTDTVVIHLFPESAAQSIAGQDQELCTPESSAQLSATAPSIPAIGFWVPISLIGQLSSTTDPNATVDFLTVGIHTLEWHVYNGPCNSENVDPVSIFVYDATATTANAGPDIEICLPQNSADMAGSEVTFPGVGQWTLGSHPGNPMIESAIDSTTTVSNLSIGITELIWTFDNGDCGITIDTMRVFVYDPTSPDAAVNNDTIMCDPPQCVNLIGSEPIFPAYGWWEQIAGDITSEINDTSSATTTACNLALNETAFVWHVYNGPCDNGLTSDTLWFYIYDSSVGIANADKDTSFCGTIAEYQLQGSTLVGNIEGLATGAWTGANGTILNADEPDAIILDIPVGVNCYTWTVDNGACGTTSDEMCITIYDSNQLPADAGEGASICSNLFEPFNLAANAVTPPGTGVWTVLSGPADIEDPQNPDAFVSYLGQIVTPLISVYDTLVWTIDNGVCGITADTIVYEIEDCETIKIPDAFSPNGDGVNDEFFISNLDYYPNNSIRIFNRWGAEVFYAAPYKGDWNGTSSASGTVGEMLPVSTYYYVLMIGAPYEEDQAGEKAGFVYLKR
jgi:gliding motility-associated-like protein